MTALQAQSGFGLLALCVLAWALGGLKRGVSARVVLMGLALQILLGAALLHIAPLRAGFSYLGDAVNALAIATQAGTSLVFGYLGGGALPFHELRPGASSCFSRLCPWCWWSARFPRCSIIGAFCPRLCA